MAVNSNLQTRNSHSARNNKIKVSLYDTEQINAGYDHLNKKGFVLFLTDEAFFHAADLFTLYNFELTSVSLAKVSVTNVGP